MAERKLKNNDKDERRVEGGIRKLGAAYHPISKVKRQQLGG